MTIDLDEKEISLILQLLGTAITIAPSQMGEYLALVQGIAAKLQPKQELTMPQTTISITVNTPSGLTVAAVTDTLCDYWGYQATLPDGTQNPQTKGQFVKAQVAAYLRSSYVAARANAETNAARVSAIATAEQVTAE